MPANKGRRLIHNSLVKAKAFRSNDDKQYGRKLHRRDGFLILRHFFFFVEVDYDGEKQYVG